MNGASVSGGATAEGILRVPVMSIGPAGLPVVTYQSVYESAPVFGAEIQLNPAAHDIQEAAVVTNLNFRAGGDQAAVEILDNLPGPSGL